MSNRRIEAMESPNAEPAPVTWPPIRAWIESRIQLDQGAKPPLAAAAPLRESRARRAISGENYK